MPVYEHFGRPCARGKFLFCGEKKLWVRGASYGAFRPDSDGNEYTDLPQIERDFEMMRRAGFNAVRIPHTMPPLALLDAALRHELHVMVGLSAEQYAGYLTDKKDAPDIEALVRAKVRSCAGHPALLCYAIGNEIPASVVRWLGRRTVEQYLERLYLAIKAEDTDGLVTYVNYPSTEYLQLPFLDLVSFNVYLESREGLQAYLARLQNLAGDRPLLMSELGLDAHRNGEHAQAHSLDWQIRSCFAAGCSGTFVFSWTDEWYRGGEDVVDWAFGLTDGERRPKPALAAATRAFAEAPLAHGKQPRISVVVCIYNGERTVRDCCEGLLRLNYSDYEVIVVDDGSTDATAQIANEYGFRVITTYNGGLSHARNVGLAAATGEIVAYTDGDARPDPDWLLFLADAFVNTSHVGIGGWNIAPPGDGPIADCVAHAPGGPVHVLLSDSIAEHIPGCCMAFRKSALEAVGGFDPQFRTAGDDVDVCWRLQQQGWTLGFSAGAMVWHHHRNSIREYWKQQRGYGQAEAMLERKWPEKYNALGHLSWAGRLYGRGLTLSLPRRQRIYQGLWGSAPFQHLVDAPPPTWRAFPLMPEWYLLVAVLVTLSIMGMAWRPLRFALPLLLASVGIIVTQAVASAGKARFTTGASGGLQRMALHAVTAFLHLLQPLARLSGRLRHGLTLWRRRGPSGMTFPRVRQVSRWMDRWQEPAERLRGIQKAMQDDGAVVLHGGVFDRWDLEVRGGLLGSARLLMAVEDTGSGTQLVRVRIWPRCSVLAVAVVLAYVALSIVGVLSRAPGVPLALAGLAGLLVARTVRDCGIATHATIRALEACVLTQAEKSRTEAEAAGPYVPEPALAMSSENALSLSSAPRLSIEAIGPRGRAARAASLQPRDDRRPNTAASSEL